MDKITLIYDQAFVMLRDKKSLVDTAIEIDQEVNIILNYYGEYLRLARMDGLVGIYRELKDDFPVFFHLYKRIKKEGLTSWKTELYLKVKCNIKYLYSPMDDKT